MNLELTDEQVALRNTMRRFLVERASIATHVRPLLDDPAGTTDVVWHGLAGLGATGVLVGEEHGGAGDEHGRGRHRRRGTRRGVAPRALALDRRRCGARAGSDGRGRYRVGSPASHPEPRSPPSGR